MQAIWQDMETAFNAHDTDGWVTHHDADGLVTEFSFYFDNLTVLIQRDAFPPPTQPE